MKLGRRLPIVDAAAVVVAHRTYPQAALGRPVPQKEGGELLLPRMKAGQQYAYSKGSSTGEIAGL